MRAHDGSSGVDLEGTPGAMLSSIEVHDVRGPGVAACIRLAASDDAVLADFECTNDLVVARPFHVVEIERSSDVTVREGLLDGSNSEYGYGVHFTQVNGQHSGGLVEDVDAIRMTNGSFSCFPHGDDITFSRTRAKQNICEIVSIPIEGCDMPGPSDGCIPGSGGITWSSSLDSAGIVILDSIYTDLCGDPVWPDTNVTVADGDLVEMPFELRARLELSYCWE